MRTRSRLMALAAAAILGAAGVALPAEKPAAGSADPNWPTNIAPWNWPTNPGTRYEMSELVKKIDRADIVIRARIPHWQKDEMGSFAVGDQYGFDAIIAHKSSRIFGSVKDGRDGGRLQRTVHWMDEKGKVLKVDPDIVKGGCVCSGVYHLYLSIPASARTARHRLNLHYTNKRLKMDVSKDFYFHVRNDGGWKANPLLERLQAEYPAAMALQNGLDCPPLGAEAYKGTDDTYMLSTHNVPDRNADFVNFGGLTYLSIGTYGQVNRTLIKFDLSSIPPAAAVKEAHLQIYLHSMPGRHPTPPEMAAFEVLKEWGPGRALGNRWLKNHVLPGDASWQCSRHPTKWAAAGCGGAGKDRSAKPVGLGPRPKGKKGWVNVTLDAEMVQRWVRDPTSNRGVLLQDKNEGRKGSGCAKYRSTEFEDPYHRPRLILAFASKLEACRTCTPAGCPVP